MLDFLKINQILEIEAGPEASFTGNYRTRVEDIFENGFVVGMPIDKGNYVPVRPNDIIIVWYWDNSATYAYYCKVKKREIEPIPLVFLEWPYLTKKVQRRGFVRIPANLSLEYKLDIGGEKNENFNKTNIRDLSGGGTQFITKTKLIKGSYLKIKLFLPNETIICKAKIMWITTENIGNHERYLIGIEFKEISEKVREKIIKYVFLRQRELIQKGVL